MADSDLDSNAFRQLLHQQLLGPPATQSPPVASGTGKRAGSRKRAAKAEGRGPTPVSMSLPHEGDGSYVPIDPAAVEDRDDAALLRSRDRLRRAHSDELDEEYAYERTAARPVKVESAGTPSLGYAQTPSSPSLLGTPIMGSPSLQSRDASFEDVHRNGHGAGTVSTPAANGLIKLAHHTMHGKWKYVMLAAALTAFAVLYTTPILREEDKDAQKCLALLVMVAMLWATEAVPLWVTSLSIPLVVICTRIILARDGQPKPAAKSAEQLLKDLMDPTVILILGGFTIAAALHKYHLDLRLSVLLLSRTTGNSRFFLLALMFLGAFLSMWVSNVAAPVLMIFVVTPVLKEMKDRGLVKCILLGISISCNIGGTITPIASPQNSVALQYLNSPDINEGISFAEWMAIAAPLAAVQLLFAWVFLLVWQAPSPAGIPPITSKGVSEMTWRHWYVLFVTVATVALWCTFKLTEDFFGNLGAIGLIPVVMLYGLDILSKHDFNSLDWNILMLLGGGAALGQAVQSSRLLDILTSSLTNALDGQSLWAVFAVFNVVIMCITNFVSHTVGAITTLQVIASVGKSFGHARRLVFAGVLSCSAASALPVSSFPNVICYSVKDSKGVSYLTIMDYLKAGVVMEIAFYGLMLSCGWLLFGAMDF